MDVFYVYTFGTAGWLGLQALPLIVSPKLIVTMLATETRDATGSYIEASMAVFSR